MDEGQTLRSRIDALNERAWTLMMRAPGEASTLAQEALAESEADDYPQGKAKASLNLAWCSVFVSRLDDAQRFASAALDIYRSLNDRLGEAMAFNALGGASQDMGRYDLALDWFSKSLELSRVIDNKARQAAALNNIGEICMDTGNPKEAMERFLAASDIIRDLDDKELEANVFGNLGVALIELGDAEEAVEYLELALDAAELTKAVGIETKILRGLGVASARKGDRLVAYTFLEQSLRCAAESHQPLGRVESLIEIARLREDEGDLADATEAVSEALSAAVGIGAKRHIADAYALLARISEDEGDFRTALDNYKLYNATEDDLSADEVTQRVRSIEARYEVERSRQEAEIYRLKNVELKEKTEELEKTTKRLIVLSSVGQRITASLDAEKVALTVYDYLSTLMDTTFFGLAWFDEERRALDFRLNMDAGQRLKPFTVRLESKDSFGVWSVTNKTPLLLSDIEQEYRHYIGARRHRFGREANSLIYVPLMFDQRVVGVLTVQSQRLDAYTNDDVETLISLGSFIAIAMENSRVHEEVRKLNLALKREKGELERLAKKVSYLANHDNLTKLPNRRLLKEFLSQAMARADRSKHRVAVMYLDLDDFKPINDRYGHNVGDLTLVIVAERIKTALRASDTISRVGGDEFVAIASDLEDAGDAEKVARKLVDSVAYPVTVQGITCTVGVSVGIALYPTDGSSAEDLMEKADRAMYAAKKNGKKNFAFFGGVTGTDL